MFVALMRQETRSVSALVEWNFVSFIHFSAENDFGASEAIYIEIRAIL
jgi:hypothetical protein